MYSRVASLVLHWAKVPPEPEPPIGAPGSVRVFRAGRRYYYLRLARWMGTQAGALAGLLFSIWFVANLYEAYAEGQRIRALSPPTLAAATRPSATPAPSPSPRASPSPLSAPSTSPAPAPASPLPAAAATAGDPSPGDSNATIEPSPSPMASTSRTRRRNRDVEGRERARVAFQRLVTRVPDFGFTMVSWFVGLMVFLEYAGIVTFFLAIPFTYALVRIEFEQHWYIVTDRSLRIRTGVVSLSESTMSFANIQQVEVKQGPIQRLLGVADVRVRSAGGGDGNDESGVEPLHIGVFKSVDNAEEIRDLIVERLRTFREAGLGDPESGASARAAARGGPAGHGVSPAALEAARELLNEARALRSAVQSSSKP